MTADAVQQLNSGLDQLIALASTTYQKYQLAAQQADLEGHALAAAFFRSISEGQSARAHSLLTLKAALTSADNNAGITEQNVRQALELSAEAEVLGRQVAEQARATLEPALLGDLEAALGLTETNRARFEGILKNLQAAQRATA